MALFSASATATTYVPMLISEQVERAKFIAHVRPTSIHLLKSGDVNCGYIYKAEVYEVLKGRNRENVEFFSPFSGENLGIGQEAIVFFYDSEMWSDSNGNMSIITGDEAYEKIHRESCGELAPRLTEAGMLRYTTARSDPLDDEYLSEDLEASEVRAWYDEKLMVVVPENAIIAEFTNVRIIRVNSVEVNGETKTLESLKERGLLPYELTKTFTLVPAKAIKQLIRDSDAAN